LTPFFIHHFICSSLRGGTPKQPKQSKVESRKSKARHCEDRRAEAIQSNDKQKYLDCFGLRPRNDDIGLYKKIKIKNKR
jgi:hypothetical protein